MPGGKRKFAIDLEMLPGSLSSVFTITPRRNNMVATASGTVQNLFDFTRSDQVSNWTENSDTIKAAGMSKAVFVIQKTQLFQRAIFFSLFNPQDGRSGFVGIRCDTNFNLSEFQNIALKCRGQGINLKYKMVLRHRGPRQDSVVYGQVFTAPQNEFAMVKLPLSNFKPYHRGMELPKQTNPLDTSMISAIGIKIDNGPYLPENQAGVAALEIDWIKATK